MQEGPRDISLAGVTSGEPGRVGRAGRAVGLSLPVAAGRCPRCRWSECPLRRVALIHNRCSLARSIEPSSPRIPCAPSPRRSAATPGLPYMRPHPSTPRTPQRSAAHRLCPSPSSQVVVVSSVQIQMPTPARLAKPAPREQQQQPFPRRRSAMPCPHAPPQVGRSAQRRRGSFRRLLVLVLSTRALRRPPRACLEVLLLPLCRLQPLRHRAQLLLQPLVLLCQFHHVALPLLDAVSPAKKMTARSASGPRARCRRLERSLGWRRHVWLVKPSGIIGAHITLQHPISGRH